MRDDHEATDTAPTPEAYIRGETLGRIQHFLQRPKNSVYTDLKGLCDRVSDSYRDRVVVELLQNAHDAHEPDRSDGRVKIILDSQEGPFGTLYVANDGRGFTANNYDALCSPSRTTKTVSEAIGNKGVGFLSVFQVSDYPEIYSRAGAGGKGFDGFCFRVADKTMLQAFLDSADLGRSAAQVRAGMPRLYLTCPLIELPDAVARLAADGFATAVRLPLKSAEAQEAVAQQLAKLRQGPPVQLFLTRIGELAIEDRSATEPLPPLRRNSHLIAATAELKLWRVSCGTQHFIVAQHKIPEAAVRPVIEADVAAGHLPDAWLEWKGDATVSLAVSAEGPPIEGQLYNFLPMGEDTHSPFSGHLDAPFYASINRLALQSRVALNDLLWDALRRLAATSAKAVRENLPAAEARTVALDLLLWTGKDRELLLNAIGDDQLVAPALKRGAQIWSSLKDLRLWTGEGLTAPPRISRVTALPLLDLAIGDRRVAALKAFVAGRYALDCTGGERADVVEALASDLLRRKRPVDDWNAFYAVLPGLFAKDAGALADRAILLTQRADLGRTNPAEVEAGGRRRRRLSAAFMPPLRVSGEGATRDLPRAVARRLDYLNSRLRITTEGADPARRFLLSNGLVRDHESREILRMLAAGMNEPGEVKDAEGLRWDILQAMMQIVIDEDISRAVVLELPILLPTPSGWIRASSAYFSSRWTGEGSSGLDRFFEACAGLSTELDEFATRRILAFADWRGAAPREHWIRFLEKAGVSDCLRPVPALLPGPTPRGYPGFLPADLARKSNLTDDQKRVWQNRMQARPTLPNPQTNHTAENVLRLAGQLELESLRPLVGKLYALQILRTLDEHPGLLRMRIYKPQLGQTSNDASWPSPAEAFLATAAWLPLADGAFSTPDRTWLPAQNLAPPPRFPVADYTIVSELMRRPHVLDALRAVGLGVYGEAGQAWRMLGTAADIVQDGVSPFEGEQLLTASQEAWLHADLKAPPSPVRLIGRRKGVIASTSLDDDGPDVLVADGDDRQFVAANLRASPETLLFDPPRSRATAIGARLAELYPDRIVRAADLAVTYECRGEPVRFSADDPFIEDVLGGGLRDLLVLSLRYRNVFYRGDREAVLQRLASVRLRWLPELSVRIGDHIEPVPRFDVRAVLLDQGDSPTILAPLALQGADRLFDGIAEALASALGNRRQLGEPLLAFASQLGSDPLASTETDYAEVLDVAVEEIRGVLGSSRAALASLLRTLLPVIALAKGDAAAGLFAPGGLIGSEDDLLRALDGLQPGLPTSSAELLRLARLGDLRPLARALRLDLAKLNAVLSRLGPPYTPIDLTADHQAALEAFLTRKEASIQETFRAAFRPAFNIGGDLAGYVRAREAPRPGLPEGFGLTSIELTPDTLTVWLQTWLANLGAPDVVQAESGRGTVGAVREGNLRTLRGLAVTLRVAVLARSGTDDPLRATFASNAAAEAALAGAGARLGWADFERLGPDQALVWLARAGLYPPHWPSSLSELAVTAEETAAVAEQDEKNRAAAASRRTVIAYGGGHFTVGVDTLGALADQISEMVARNTGLLATSTQVATGEAPRLPGRSSGSGAGSSWTSASQPRSSEDERNLIGFFGEAIAYRWLQRRFGDRRSVDLNCWKSGYREHMGGEAGNDELGYDFEVRNGRTHWYYEVKATKLETPPVRAMIEVGSSEIAHAEICRADRRHRYRILYVVGALSPQTARLYVLPNPRSRAGERFFANADTGVRLYFPTPR